MRYAIVGSGKFGRELTRILLNNGKKVLLFSRRATEIDSINSNSKSLTGFIFPNAQNLKATNDPLELSKARCLFLTFSSKDIKNALSSLPINHNQTFISCIKGFENSLGLLPSEVLIQKFGVKKKNIIVLSGPNLSKEIANKELTATVLAGENNELLREIGKDLKNDYFIPFLSSDINGVEIAGALKNIYAIVSGYFHAKRVGENTIGFLLTKSLEEIRIFSQARGGESETFLGLSGVGDFFSTALSKDSRNYKFGECLAKGLNAEEALKKIDDTVEGYHTSKVVYQKSIELGLDLKILKFLIDLYTMKKSKEETAKILVPDHIENDIRSKL